MSILEGKKVLVVDDEVAICDVLAQLLVSYNMIVDEANDGFEAFEKIKLNRYDFVISDVRMPKCSGSELLKLIQDYPGHTPKVIMMSAFSDLTNDSARASGALALLMKPSVFTEVIDLMEMELS